DIERSYARTNQDRLHVFVESFLYQLPVGPGRRWLSDGPLSQVLGGWQVSGFFTAQSGLPIDFTMSGANLRAPNNTHRPDSSGPPALLGVSAPGNLWFDPSVFWSPPANPFGNAVRKDPLDGPRSVNLDATVAKLLSFPHGLKGEGPPDIFNVTNTPHFDRP